MSCFCLQFVLVETVTTALMDRFVKLRDYKLLTVMGLCTVFFLLGLTLTTNVSTNLLPNKSHQSVNTRITLAILHNHW